MSICVLLCSAINERAAVPVAEVLAREADLQVTSCACCRQDDCACAQSCATCPGNVPADVIVAAIGLPGDHDLALLGEARDRHPGARLIVLSLYDEPYVRQSAIAHGAALLLPLEEAAWQLAAAVRAAATADFSRLAAFVPNKLDRADIA